MDKQHRLGARHLKIPTKHSRDSKDRNTEIDSGSDYEYSWVEAEAEVDGRDEKVGLEMVMRFLFVLRHRSSILNILFRIAARG